MEKLMYICWDAMAAWQQGNGSNKRLEGAKERLQLVRTNLMEEGNFDEAIKGCHGVFHTDSPIVKPSFDPKARRNHRTSCEKDDECAAFMCEKFISKACSSHLIVEIIEPSVKGTLNVLHSCAKNPSLRHVVLTSSSSTVRARDDFDPKIPLEESSWSSVYLYKKLQA
ncbi:hypothetical protein Patl1_35555 [Pistacia atlantica]|nr:hypothetical protein Patl1_35555 [Pistacia atlantica]